MNSFNAIRSFRTPGGLRGLLRGLGTLLCLACALRGVPAEEVRQPAAASALEYLYAFPGGFNDALYQRVDAEGRSDVLFLAGNTLELLDPSVLNGQAPPESYATVALPEECIRLVTVGERVLVGQYRRNQGDYVSASPNITLSATAEKSRADYPLFALDYYNPAGPAPVPVRPPAFPAGWWEHPDLNDSYDTSRMVYNDPCIASDGNDLVVVANRYQDRLRAGQANWPFWWDLSVSRWSFKNPFHSMPRADQVFAWTGLDDSYAKQHTYWYRDRAATGVAALAGRRVFVAGRILDLDTNGTRTSVQIGARPRVLQTPGGVYVVSLVDALSESVGFPGDVVIADVGGADPVPVRRFSPSGEAGVTALNAPAQDIALVDNLLFVAEGQGGFQVFDLADPSAPAESRLGLQTGLTSPNAQRIWAFRNRLAGNDINILVLDALLGDEPANGQTDVYLLSAQELPPDFPGAATAPSPADQARSVAIDAQLSWTAGKDALSHDVYFGAVGETLQKVAAGQAATSFNPGRMQYGASYLWRVDERNAAGVTQGAEWTFSTRYWVDGLGYNAGWRVDLHPRTTADVNGDGRADIVGFSDRGVVVALSEGDHFDAPAQWLRSFGYSGGWRLERHLRMLVDMNNDGMADVVGFPNRGVVVSLSTGAGFTEPAQWSAGFGYRDGWRIERHIRTLVDMDVDGYPDLVAFGDKAVTVALNQGGTGFAAPVVWIKDYCYQQGWETGRHLRFLSDVNKDFASDLVGFFDDGVYVSRTLNLSTTQVPDFAAFEAAGRWLDDLGYRQGWMPTLHERLPADVNGDGRADIVGFGDQGVFVSRATGFSFTPALQVSADFSTQAGYTPDRSLRLAQDQNNDGRADLVVFGDSAVTLQLSTAGGANMTFAAPALWSSRFTYNDGWRVDSHPRLLADVNGDKYLDIVGFGADGVSVLPAEVPKTAAAPSTASDE